MNEPGVEDIKRVYNFMRTKNFGPISTLEAVEIGMAGNMISATVVMAWLQLSRGDLARADALLRKAEAICSPREAGYILHLHAVMMLQTGDIDTWALIERRVVDASRRFGQEELFIDVLLQVSAIIAELGYRELSTDHNTERKNLSPMKMLSLEDRE